jgi:hypothetical protein
LGSGDPGGRSAAEEGRRTNRPRTNNDLDAEENPVDVAANARHHSPGYAMPAYGRRHADWVRKLAGASATRIG